MKLLKQNHFNAFFFFFLHFGKNIENIAVVFFLMLVIEHTLKKSNKK